MGMKPGEGFTGTDIANIIAQLGASGIEAWGMPDGQELQSFEGNTNVDPRNMYGEARDQINDMTGLLKARAMRPVSTRSGYVQQPPVFTGGGLPMPIGVVGMDPALADRSLLSLPGMSGATVDPIIRDQPRPPRVPGPPITPDPNSPGPGGGEEKPPNNGPFTSGPTAGPTAPAPADDPRVIGPGPRSGPMRRSMSGQSMFTAPNVSEHDDLGQGMGAMEVYLRNLTGGVQ